MDLTPHERHRSAVSPMREWLDQIPEWARDEVEREWYATERIYAAVDALVETIATWPRIWDQCDGYGGCVISRLDGGLREIGLSRTPPRIVKRAPEAPPVPWPMRYTVMERDGFTCQGCGVQKDLTMDHRLPQKCGGKNSLENLQTLCRACNSEKGAKTDEEWRAWKAAR